MDSRSTLSSRPTRCMQLEFTCSRQGALHYNGRIGPTWDNPKLRHNYLLAVESGLT